MYASGLTVKDVDYSKDKEDKSQGCPPLLPASYARKEADRKGAKKKLSPL